MIHSLYIPAFRLKQDAVPGVPQKMIATPDRLGTYMVTCAELCGIGHSQMRTVLHVLNPADFTAWIAEQKKAAAAACGRREHRPGGDLLVDLRELPHVQAGRASGTVGPDLDNLTADAAKYGAGQSPEDYVRESITDPEKVAGLGLPGRRHAHELRDEPDVGPDRRTREVPAGRREAELASHVHEMTEPVHHADGEEARGAASGCAGAGCGRSGSRRSWGLRPRAS